MRLTKNFTDDEFRCPCCGGLNDTGAFRQFVYKLQVARNYAGIPFIITSGYRCPKHNKAVGGSPGSSHILGIAADIRVRSSAERFKIVEGLMIAGFTRIGIAASFVHVDIDTDKPNCVMWLYGDK